MLPHAGSPNCFPSSPNLFSYPWPFPLNLFPNANRTLQQDPFFSPASSCPPAQAPSFSFRLDPLRPLPLLPLLLSSGLRAFTVIPSPPSVPPSDFIFLLPFSLDTPCSVRPHFSRFPTSFLLFLKHSELESCPPSYSPNGFPPNTPTFKQTPSHSWSSSLLLVRPS